MQTHVVIKGVVQGVGFRHFVRHKARKLGVFGWVKNTSTGQVEALFEGSKEAIETMITVCKKGPWLSQVTDTIVTWNEKEEGNFTDFVIVREEK